MGGIQIAKSVSAIVLTAATVIGLLFINFLTRKSSATVFGLEIPTSFVHAVLGPLLVFLNGLLFVYLCALLQTRTNDSDITVIQQQNKYGFLGFLVNPFYIGGSRAVSAIGYAFLIILWWLGFHAFLYSLTLSRAPDSAWIFGWQLLISVLYLSLGLASMIAIQACWYKFGVHAYSWKWAAGFVGIPAGAFLPPILLRLGIPHLPTV